MSVEIGLFAEKDGWRVALRDQHQKFNAREAAVAAAVREASLARWRGEEVRVLAQDHVGGPLQPLILDEADPRHA